MERAILSIRGQLVLILGYFFLATQVYGGVVGKDTRLPIAQYAAKHNLSEPEARSRFAASGRIMCPFNEGTAFLVFQDDIIMTARHNLFPEKNMIGYAGKSEINRCGFEVSFGKTSTWYDVNVSSFVYPKEQQRSATDRFDWVIMKLTKPVQGVRPYQLADIPAKRDLPITVASIRQEGFPHEDWNERIVTDCYVRKVWAIDFIAGSGLETDCSLSLKSSGAPLLTEGRNGLEVVGIQSAGSRNCRKFRSMKCGNWAVGITEEMKTAIRLLADCTTMSGQPYPNSGSSNGGKIQKKE